MEDKVAPVPLIHAARLNSDVFLSFQGEDTRETLIKDLCNALQDKGLRAFIDEDGLIRGDEIASKLLEAIRDAATAIVVLSPKYADSPWRLRELAEICESKRLILPVFYDVDPSDVRRQTGDFKANFDAYEVQYEAKELLKWREAFKKVGSIAGFRKWSYGDGQQLVRAVVKRVLSELSNTPEYVAPYTVGLDTRLTDLMKLLDVRSNLVQVLGIYGMGGIGKTTLAKALYNKLVGYFEKHVLISSIREHSSKADGLSSLQAELMSGLFREGSPYMFSDVDAGLNAIREKVVGRRVLIVLDDADSIDQLHALAGKREWFGDGTRIVITTRNQDILYQYQVNQNYEVGLLDDSQALKLFSFHAFKSETPTESFLDLSKRIVSRTKGLPLALEVFGSYLLDKRTRELWEGALQKLEKSRPENLHDVLKISYDDLEGEQRIIFLDIACLFTNSKMNKDEIIDALRGCGFRAQLAIDVLKKRSLIKILEDNMLWMHDQVKDMGRQIVCKESLIDPSRRSRLWDRAEITAVLTSNKGTKHVQGIFLDFEKSFVKDPSPYQIAARHFRSRGDISSAARYYLEKIKNYFQDQLKEDYEAVLHVQTFKSMSDLRLLQINHVKLEGWDIVLPAELKWLQWRDCPYKSFPSRFFPPELAVLDLAESRVQRLWHSCCFNRVAIRNLTVLNLNRCYNLEAVPNLSECKALEKLLLEGCHNLVKIHESVGSLQKLLYLSLKECKNLLEFLEDVSGLHSLRRLNMSGCKKLKKLPENIGDLRCLKELVVDDTAITVIPDSIADVVNLEIFSLRRCVFLKQLPMCIGELQFLKELDVGSSELQELPESIASLGNLERLNLMHCKSLSSIPDGVDKLVSLEGLFLNGSAILKLPDSLGSLPRLTALTVGGCSSLNELPHTLGGLGFLTELELDNIPIKYLPAEIGNMGFVQQLKIRNCKLRYLPESIGEMYNLHGLYLSGSDIVELPESIGKLEKLVILRLNGCKKLCRLPDSFGNLKSLHHLHMQETSVANLPENFGNLSKLMILKMLKKPLFRTHNTDELGDMGRVIKQEGPDFINLPSSFSNLHSLEELDARSWKICGKVSDDFVKLSSLVILNLGNNYFHSLPCSLNGLSHLRKLLLYDCQELKSLPPLPSTLQELNMANCVSLENICDVSNLKDLQDVNFTNCEKIVDVPGLESLKCLRRLYMSGCGASSESVKKRLSKATLKQLRNLSVPGSKIPDWFSSDAITYSVQRLRDLKGVILAVVVSLDHNEPDHLRYQIPAVVDIQARVVKMDLPIFTHSLQLFGVPRKNEDQIHLCRYPAFHPLVSMLKDGHKLELKKRDPPYVKGVQLKKSGICLVFDHDDTYDGEEENLDEKHQTISEKLANFFGSLTQDDSS